MLVQLVELHEFSTIPVIDEHDTVHVEVLFFNTADSIMIHWDNRIRMSIHPI